MARIKTGFVSGVIDDNPLLIGATTLTATELGDLPEIASPDIAAIVLDPAGTAGAPEIVHVTAHTAAATTATIVRAREGTTAREHLQSVPWVHGPTVEDFDQTKEFFVPALRNSSQSGAAYEALADWDAVVLDNGQYCSFNFLIPADFNSIETAEILVHPDATETIQWDATTDWATVGDTYPHASDSVSTQNKAVTANVIAGIDISALLDSGTNALTAGDFVGLRFTSRTTSIYVLGLHIKYV